MYTPTFKTYEDYCKYYGLVTKTYDDLDLVDARMAAANKAKVETDETGEKYVRVIKPN